MGGIRVEINEQQCLLCSSNLSLLQVQGKWICEKCIHNGIEQLTFKWINPLGNLFKEYRDACNRYLSNEESDDFFQISIIGRKIRTILLFLGIPKKHKLLLLIRKMNRLVKRVEETAVVYNQIKQESGGNIVYSEMVNVLLKKQKKQNSMIKAIMPKILNDSFFHKMEKLINNELAAYVVQIEKEKVLQKYEESFIRLVESYQLSVEENGKTSDEAIKALHDLRKKSKSLRSIYNFLNQTDGNDFQEKVSFHKNFQLQFDEIDSAEGWIYQFKACEKRINAPNSDINNVKKELKARLHQLIENFNLDLSELPIKEM